MEPWLHLCAEEKNRPGINLVPGSLFQHLRGGAGKTASGGRCWQEQAGPGAPWPVGRESRVEGLPKPGQAGAWARHSKKDKPLNAVWAGLGKRKASMGNMSKHRRCGRNQIQKLKSPILCPHRQTQRPRREPGPQSVLSVVLHHC